MYEVYTRYRSGSFYFELVSFSGGGMFKFLSCVDIYIYSGIILFEYSIDVALLCCRLIILIDRYWWVLVRAQQHQTAAAVNSGSSLKLRSKYSTNSFVDVI